MSAVYATLRSQASNITFAAISGGALTGSGTLYLTAQLRSRSGLNLPQTPVSLSYTAGQRVSVTIGAAALAAAEAGSAHEVVISGAATNSLSAMVRLASFSLLQADQLTQVSLPQTFYLSQPAHIALAAVVANPAALPTGSSLMQGMVRQVTSLSANYYKYDSAVTAGDIAASTGYWSLFYPWIDAGNGFTTYIGTSTDNPGGCDYPLQSVGSDALPLPAYNPAAGASTPLRVAIENGLTEDGGSSIAALSQIGMTVLANGVDLSAAFSGAIDVTYLGLARKSDGSLDTSNANVGVSQTVTLYANIANAQQNAQGNATLSSYATTNLTFPQAVPRGYFALFTVRFNSRANMIAQLFNGENVTLYMSDIGSVGKYSPMAVIFSGNTAGGTVIQYPGLASVGATDGYLRILPGVNSVVRQPGFGCFQGFEAGPLAGTAAATLSIADTAGQKVAIAGTSNGQIIVRQPSDTLLPTEALRAKVSTLPGTADATATGAAFSGAVSVGAAGTLNLTLTYPTTIRANYPDVIAGTIAPYNVPRLKVYLKIGGVITEQSALVTVTPGGGTQNIVISTNTGSTVSALPTNADPAFCLFNAPSATGSAGTGGSLAAGSYQYAVVPHFPASNTQATAISHKVLDGCVPEILTDLATAIGGAKGYTTVSSPGFVQPAVGSTVVAPVSVTDFFGVEQPVFVTGGGGYTLQGKTSNSLTLLREIDNGGAYAATGGTISSGAGVYPGGKNGAVSATSTIGLTQVGSAPTGSSSSTTLFNLNGLLSWVLNTASTVYQVATTNLAQLWSGAQRPSTTVLTQASGTLTIDASLNNFYAVTLSASITTLTITNVQTGTNFELFITQDATGGRTIAKPSSCLIPGGGTTFPIATAANAASNIAFRSVDGTTLRCDVGGGTGGYA